MAQNGTNKDIPHQLNTPPLAFHDVSVAYAPVGRPREKSAVYALQNVTFNAEAGEQIAIIGSNGAGKSTLLKVAAGILKPDSGRVTISGSDPNHHICIAYVPQRSEIDWQFPVTVADVVMMGRTKRIGLFGRPRKRDHDIVHNALERVNATDLANKQIGELSGGQQQRVFIARALAMDAHLLLMDEPLGGLDIPSQKATLELLAQFRDENVTVLLATHDLGVAADYFDRIMLLKKRIVAQGKADEVLTAANLLTAYGGHQGEIA